MGVFHKNFKPMPFISYESFTLFPLDEIVLMLLLVTVQLLNGFDQICAIKFILPNTNCLYASKYHCKKYRYQYR